MERRERGREREGEREIGKERGEKEREGEKERWGQERGGRKRREWRESGWEIDRGGRDREGRERRERWGTCKDRPTDRKAAIQKHRYTLTETTWDREAWQSQRKFERVRVQDTDIYI